MTLVQRDNFINYKLNRGRESGTMFASVIHELHFSCSWITTIRILLFGWMELDLPTPVSYPPSLGWCSHTVQHTLGANAEWRGKGLQSVGTPHNAWHHPREGGWDTGVGRPSSIKARQTRSGYISKQSLCLFLSPGARRGGWTQTLDLWIVNQVLQHWLYHVRYFRTLIYKWIH